MMILYLTRKVGTEPIPLSLPATPADIGNAFSELDAICPDRSATEIYKVDSEVRNLNQYICEADVENRETLRKLNQLAELLQGMSREDQMRMEGVLDSNSINSMDDILNAASMVKEYVLLEEVDSDRTLGNYLVEHGVIDCPENIKPYLDYVGIGAEFYSDHGGAYEQNEKCGICPLRPRFGSGNECSRGAGGGIAESGAVHKPHSRGWAAGTDDRLYHQRQ